MMRATHTLKGAAGTVGLPAMVDLAHRLESVLAGFGRDPSRWTAGMAEALVEVIDALRTYLDMMDDPGAGQMADELRTSIEQLALPQPNRRAGTQPPVAIEPVAGDAAGDAGPGAEAGAAPDAGSLVEPRAWLRIEPARVDEVMSSAGELLFDRTRIERRVQLLRTLARDLARTRQVLHDAVADDAAMPSPLRNAVMDAEGDLAGQAALLSRTTRRCSTRSRRCGGRSASCSAG